MFAFTLVIFVNLFALHKLADCTDCTEESLVISYPSSTENYVYCGQRQAARVSLPSDRAIVRLETRLQTSADLTYRGFSANVYFHPRKSGGLNKARCGVARVPPWDSGGRAAEKVVGGLVARKGSWPWVVRLRGVSCGGALINAR